MTFEIDVVWRILMALLCGGIIGYEREYKNRPAGLRTHMLVCIGAALVMIISQFIYEKYTPGTNDPARLGAQVISGIGFLGAGTIIRERFSVKGLTTAATLWVVACIGLAIGSGYYIIAGIATLVIFLSLIIFRKLENFLKIKENKAKLRITVQYSKEIEKTVRNELIGKGYKVKNMKFAKSRDLSTVMLSYDIASPNNSGNWESLCESLYNNPLVLRADIDA
jgi:putative Mg2+ transporter-C (MgtC) family protein